ncbi:hypothetical protein SAY86_024019 [Trapa natans]|uniref:Pectinesterase n=1 Tax=Trapa natans TaxID=22666 RepID=A0AAN7LWQ2_TRANT|nr:hypothetical protein SAY86_024019 [Trapa natans]
MMVGDGMDVTVISGNRSFIGGWTTFRSATFGEIYKLDLQNISHNFKREICFCTVLRIPRPCSAVSGREFIARNMTFENTVGPEKYQAVAVRSDSDLSVFYRCSIKGYQDTLYTHALRQFFRECRISGTVDFIFGDASALFQNCLIQPKKGLQSQKNTITAQARKESNQPTGFSFQFCNITADLDLQPFINTTMTYLGRPWKLYSRAVFMQSYLSEVPQPEGWLEWNDNFALNTLFYGEYMNNGPGAGLGRRIKWPGFRVLNSSSQAVNYTVAQFIEGNSWLPSTGVTYVAGFGL